MKILIKNGRVIDPATGLDEVCDVAIAAGRILSIKNIAAGFSANRVIEADLRISLTRLRSEGGIRLHCLARQRFP
jgi:predicted amidohydrolase